MFPGSDYDFYSTNSDMGAVWFFLVIQHAAATLFLRELQLFLDADIGHRPKGHRSGQYSMCRGYTARCGVNCRQSVGVNIHV